MRLLVTSALPYANGDIHLGHMVEVIQTDIYVRFMKMQGHEVRYICADDTHGTPIELSARRQGITPEKLVEKAWKNHVKDFSSFSIDFDIFYTTNSPENKYYSEHIFSKLKEKGLVFEKEIEQFYDEAEERFLPDRFVKGTCPGCGAEDQYGDACEKCGATYNPSELKSPRSVVSGKKPVMKRSKHFFVELSKRKEFLSEFINSGALQDEMRNFVSTWIDEGLREWCISRDGPYFGFKIPGTENKYFYVWLDAPIGYLSSTAKWCKDNKRDVMEFWGKNPDSRLVHFIGKDIVYFHTLFWPVMLDSAEFTVPSKVFIHGFLTVEGEKMSKTRGTFILAKDFTEKVRHPLASEYLRFYYGAKLSAAVADIDLNFGEFCNRINSTLVNNIGNLHHRTSVFIDRYFEGRIPNAQWDNNIMEQVEKTAQEIKNCFENVDTRGAVEKIHSLGSLGNKFYQDSEPWKVIKEDRKKAESIMVTCINIVKSLAVFLKPIVPDTAARLEKQLGKKLEWDDYKFSLKNSNLKKPEKIVTPIDRSEFDSLLASDVSQGGADNLISIDDFAKIKLKTASVVSAEKIRKSDKLLKLKVNDGSRTRQIVAGIAKHYTPDEIKGKTIVIVSNLKPARLMGETSEGMLLAAKKGGSLVLITPEKNIKPGAEIS